MNIFILSYDPVKAAKYQIDKHIVKMPTESGQMLATAFWDINNFTVKVVNNRRKKFFKPVVKGLIPLYNMTHYNHPCSIWCRESKENFLWLVQHTETLYEEYQRRYGPNDKHGKIKDMLDFCRQHYTKLDFPKEGLTPFAIAMPDKYKVKDKPVASYRRYYRGDKSVFATWTKTKQPNWFNRK